MDKKKIYAFPRKGTLTDAGDGEGVGASNHKKSQQLTKKTFRTETVHTSRHFSKNVQKNFKICSYIQKMTPDPINALKITIYNTEAHQ